VVLASSPRCVLPVYRGGFDPGHDDGLTSMKTVWLWTRASLRRRLAGTVLLVLLVGLTGGAVLAAATGARRTSTAFPRLVAATGNNGVLVGSFGPGTLGFYKDVQALPGIANSGVFVGMYISPVSEEGAATGGVTLVSTDGRAGYSVASVKVLEGRLPDPTKADELLVDRASARAGHLHVGQRVPMRLFKSGVEPKDPDHVLPSEGTPLGEMRIVGIMVTPDEIVPVTVGIGTQMMGTPALWKRIGDPTKAEFDGMFLILKPGTDPQALHEQVVRVAAKHPEAGGQALFDLESEKWVRAERAIRPQAAALALFAAVSALVMLLVLGQAMSRQIALDGFEAPTLQALGVTRRQIILASLIRVAIIASAGAIIAVVIAIATSSLMPIGPARLAEPNPGLAVNASILAAGAAAIVVAFLAWSFVPAWRSVSAADRKTKPSASTSAVAETIGRSGAPTSATVGVRLALSPGAGRTAVPVRSAMIGTGLAVAALVASLVFGAALDRLVTDPHAFGWNWDVMLDASFGVMPTASLDRLLDDDAVAGWTGGLYASANVSGKTVPAIGLDVRKGRVLPTLISGRAPQSEHEIVLGPRTLRLVHASVGDTVDVRAAQFDQSSVPTRKMKIVGSAVFPSLGRGTFAPTGLGDGALVTAAVLADPEVAAQQGGEAPGDLYNFALVRFAPGKEAARAEITRGLFAMPACRDQECGALASTKRRPADIANYARVRSTQLALAGLLFALAALTVGHTLVTAVRRRRSDLAIMKTIGFSRGQLSSMVAWQATTYAVVACALGIPAGVALGRWAWITFAGELGVPPDVPVPLMSIVLPLAATFALANLAAALPARTAGRVRPALVLRAE
jgi:putative ABC transport system permease protein